MKKVYIVNSDASYHALFAGLGFEIATSVEFADLVCFTGGSDVSPAMYFHEQHQTTGPNPHRDHQELQIFRLCIEHDIPMVGICRGGQFLNVCSGGTMYQDVTRHISSHYITDCRTGDVIYVSSTHHQMMKPSERGLLVASSTNEGTRLWWENGVFKKEVSTEDVEVVWYQHTKSLCFQPHPEFDGASYEWMRKYFGSLIQEFILN
jgi:carbamoylphosphate synthase small subunit